MFTKFKKRFTIVRALQNLISELLHSATKSGLSKLTAVSLLLTYLLTPWRRVLLEKITGLQLVKKFPAFHGTRRCITALTSVRHLSLSWASPIQSIYPHPTSWRSILILSTHLRLGLPCGLLPSADQWGDLGVDGWIRVGWIHTYLRNEAKIDFLPVENIWLRNEEFKKQGGNAITKTEGESGRRGGRTNLREKM